MTRDRRNGVQGASHAPQRAPLPTAPVNFVELVASADGRHADESPSSIELVLRGGYRVRVAPDFDGEVLTRVLDLLEARR